MLLIEQRAASDAVATVQLTLSFERRCKSRLRTRLVSGEECGLFLERGTVLRGGDKLLANNGVVVEVISNEFQPTSEVGRQVLAKRIGGSA